MYVYLLYVYDVCNNVWLHFIAYISLYFLVQT